MQPAEAFYTFKEPVYKYSDDTVVIIDRAYESLSVSDVQLLEKILSAVKRHMHAVRIITLRDPDSGQLTALHAKYIISFGCKTKDPQPTYQTIGMNTTKMILADSLDQLTDQRKKDLWAALKQMFTV